MAVNGFQDKKVSQTIAISYKLMTFNEPATLLKELGVELKSLMVLSKHNSLTFLNLIPDNQFLLPHSVTIAHHGPDVSALRIWTGFYRVSCAIIG